MAKKQDQNMTVRFKSLIVEIKESKFDDFVEDINTLLDKYKEEGNLEPHYEYVLEG